MKNLSKINLNKKTVIITGAGSGFGYRTAEVLEELFNLILIEMDEQNFLKMKKRFKNAINIKADISTKLGIEQLDKKIRNINIDFCINNAGWTYYKKLSELTTEEEFDNVFRINVKSIFLMSNYLIPQFKNNKNGYILNIGSSAAIRPRGGLVWYNATKAAVNNITKSLAVELGPYNVRVNCLNPAYTIGTGLSQAFSGDVVTEELINEYNKMTPLGRMCTINDVANTIKDLLTCDNLFITGQIYNLDGGRCI